MRRAVLLLCLLALAAVIAWAAGALGGDRPRLPLGGDDPRLPLAGPSQVVPPSVAAPRDPAPGSVSLAGPDALRIKLKRPPRAGLVFDLDSGKVLWSRHARSPLPIASLTKIMTALLVSENTGPRARVLIRPSALFFDGQAVGNLPVGKRVPIDALLHAALLTSGNDAALALADHVSGSEKGFVRLMNRRARKLRLTCSRFVSPHGLEDENRSCAADLAALTRLVMRRRRIAEVVKKPQADFRFPIRGGRLYVSTTNPLLLSGYPGTIGLKTGYTEKAGSCFVAVVRRGRRRLAAVLLHSPDSAAQARQLLERGFKAG